MKKIFAVLILFVLAQTASAQQAMPLWPAGKIPNAQNSSDKEKRDTTQIVVIRLVQTPEMTVYLPTPRTATGQAVIICPGGAYSALSYSLEGTDIAGWLLSKGITPIVLKYRLPVSKSNVTPHLTPLLDAKRAMRIVRANAAKWRLKPDRIGIMGFSAGGHLAATLATHFDNGNPTAVDTIERQSSRPDFAVLVYPVITMTKSIMHVGSRNNLLGKTPDEALAKEYSNELQVTKNTPPIFLVHTIDDNIVPVENSIIFFQAMRENKVDGELHIMPKGGHGFGLGLGKGAVEQWTNLCLSWMQGLYQK